jgi:hypothetical protein
MSIFIYREITENEQSMHIESGKAIALVCESEIPNLTITAVPSFNTPMMDPQTRHAF